MHQQMYSDCVTNALHQINPCWSQEFRVVTNLSWSNFSVLHVFFVSENGHCSHYSMRSCAISLESSFGTEVIFNLILFLKKYDVIFFLAFSNEKNGYLYYKCVNEKRNLISEKGPLETREQKSGNSATTVPLSLSLFISLWLKCLFFVEKKWRAEIREL